MATDNPLENFKEFPPVAMLNRVAEWIADASMFVSCIVLLWLVGLTCVDVVGRYFFERRSQGLPSSCRFRWQASSSLPADDVPS